LITPDNLVANALPHFAGTVARPLATPRGTAAKFGQYLLEFEPAGHSLRPQGAGFESFLYQITGEVTVRSQDTVHKLANGDYCYLPSGVEFSIQAFASTGAKTLWTKRRYEPVDGVALPAVTFANQADAVDIVPPPPGSYTYRELLPAADPSFDFAMNVLTAEPGGSIGMIEIHHQEHGLLMLGGRGIYYLAGDFHEVAEGDYIYMAPYCPQTFYSIGDAPTSYLLYKDVNRDGF
jgi:(S)-ureidoglycine aminohydrolase